MDDIKQPLDINLLLLPFAKQHLETFLQDWPTTTPESYVEFYLNGWLAHNSRKFEGTRLDVMVPPFEKKILRKNKKLSLRNFILQICVFNGSSFYGTYYKSFFQEPIYAISDGNHADKSLRVIVCTKQDVIKQNLDDVAFAIKMFTTSRNLIN